MMNTFAAWKMELVARCSYDFFRTWNDFLQFKLLDFPDMLQMQFKVRFMKYCNV